jgi:flavin reductase (DIM6/NTAB) family NADH-FMN oxidoreductase RutF
MTNKIEVSNNFFPYLLHPYNSTLVTTIDKNNKPNIIVIAWVIPLSRNPPYLAMGINKNRYSYKLIAESREFVVNIPSYDLAKKVIFCGRKSGREVDKFKETKLTPEKAKMVSPPIIKECVAHIECKLDRIIEVGDHDLFIGKVLTAYASKEVFSEHYDFKKFKPLLHAGGDFFTTTIDEIEKYTP